MFTIANKFVDSEAFIPDMKLEPEHLDMNSGEANE